MKTQAEKASTFEKLHQQDHAFIIPNPWDVGSARLLEKLGFQALASTSAGYAFSLGVRDTKVGRDAMIAHVAQLAASTDLPVSADLENCYGDEPSVVAETIRLAAAAGLAGCSIEDSTGRQSDPIYEFSLSVARVRAAAEVVRALPFPFMLTARCENYGFGRPDLGDTIKRLQAYQEAGANVLYAPGLRSKDDIASVVRAVDRPVNVLLPPGMTVAELSSLGVKRLSVGSGLARVALGAFLDAATELRDHGRLNVSRAVTYADISAMFSS